MRDRDIEMLHPLGVLAVANYISPADDGTAHRDGHVGVAGHQQGLHLATDRAGEPLADHVPQGLGEHVHVGEVPRPAHPHVKAAVEEQDLEGRLEATAVFVGDQLDVLPVVGPAVGGERAAEGGLLRDGRRSLVVAAGEGCRGAVVGSGDGGGLRRLIG